MQVSWVIGLGSCLAEEDLEVLVNNWLNLSQQAKNIHPALHQQKSMASRTREVNVPLYVLYTGKTTT